MSLGYSYPELQPWLDKYETDGQFDGAKYTKDIRNQIRNLYRPLSLSAVSRWLDESLKSDIIVNITFNR